MGPPRRRDGGLSSESNSVVRRFSPSPPDLVLLSFAHRKFRISTCPSRRGIADVLEISDGLLLRNSLSIVPTCVLDLDFFRWVLCRNSNPAKDFASATCRRFACISYIYIFLLIMAIYGRARWPVKVNIYYIFVSRAREINFYSENYPLYFTNITISIFKKYFFVYIKFHLSIDDVIAIIIYKLFHK